MECLKLLHRLCSHLLGVGKYKFFNKTLALCPCFTTIFEWKFKIINTLKHIFMSLLANVNRLNSTHIRSYA